MTEVEFGRRFFELTGKSPLHWQRRLFHEHFAFGDLRDVIDLPTGLGKTMIMAIWLIAREINMKLPRRLIYVVDRRTVVDQATDLAIELQQSVSKDKLAISTLRGQLADNRDWSRDLSKTAIIIGTVDLIGSALLFSGYRSSFKRRPLEAGLLGQDSLLVLDEAHLSKPFEKLICAINDTGRFQKDRNDKAQGKPMRVIRMSATSGDSECKDAFRLDVEPSSPTFDLKTDPDPETGAERNPIVTRYRAKKRLKINGAVESKNLDRALADAAIELAEDATLVGKRIVVFVRSPENAKAIANRIKEHNKPVKSKANPDPKRPFADSVEILAGTGPRPH